MLNGKLATTEKLAYGLGDAGANFIFQFQITFLLYFYTNVLGLTSGAAGYILLGSRIFDACTDPLVGALADRSRTRWGYFRPWILFSAIPLAITFTLCYTVPNFGSTGKIAWAIVTYNLLMLFYAANNIPYCALGGVMTADSQERTSLASWRFACAMGATLLVGTFSRQLVHIFGNGNESVGYQATTALWAVLAIMLFVITFAFTREQISPPPRQQSTLCQDVRDLVGNRAWLSLFAIAILIYIQLALRSGSVLYYFEYCVNAERYFGWTDNFGLFNGIGLACTLVGVGISKTLVARIGKVTAFRTCLVAAATFMALFALVPAESFATMLALQIGLQLSFGPTIPILWAMMADVADYSEWRTGRRSTALAFASMIFGLKLGFGIGGWLGGEVLHWFDYSASGPLSAAAVRGIILTVSLFPAAALVLAAAVSQFYPLNEKVTIQFEEELLARKRTEQAVDQPE